MRRLLICLVVIISTVAVAVIFYDKTSFGKSLTASPISPSLSIFPSASVLQGEPIMMVLNSVAGTSSTSSIVAVQKMFFDGKPLDVFLYQSKPTAFIGIDLSKKPGVYVLKTVLTNGKILQKNITVANARKPSHLSAYQKSSVEIRPPQRTNS